MDESAMLALITTSSIGGLLLAQTLRGLGALAWSSRG